LRKLLDILLFYIFEFVNGDLLFSSLPGLDHPGSV